MKTFSARKRRESPGALKMSHGTISRPTNRMIEAAIDEMTSSGAAGPYEVPLGKRPAFLIRKRKQKKRSTSPLV